jgi:hypothetical protein
MECELLGFFSTKFAKTIISRLKVEKTFCKEEIPIPVFFFTKSASNSSEQNIYRNRRVKIYFQRCCASQLKQNTKDQDKLKLNSYALKIYISTVL